MAFEVESGQSLVAYVEEFAEDDLPFTKVAMKGIFDPFQGTLTKSVILAQDRFRVVRSTSIACTDSAWCLVYQDFTGQTLNAFFKDASLEQPSKETVPTATIFPVVPSVATARGLGAPGKDFAVAYGDDNKLKVASRNKFGEWTVEVVDSEGGDMPSFNYDRSGKAHIAYAVGQKLKYARGTE
jgi:hypothetical protein